MIQAAFRRRGGTFCSVTLSGHAGWAEAGEDIVCAAATSAFQLCANAVTEILSVPAEVAIGEDTAGITLPPDSGPSAVAFLSALHLHLSILQEQYPHNITTTITEV